MPACPKCGFVNSSSATNCAKCRINLKYALEHVSEIVTEQRIINEEEIEQEVFKLEAEKILVTTTPIIQGRNITKYIDVYSSIVVLGTGFLSEFSAQVSDIFGTRSGAFQEKLDNATQSAIGELRQQAAKHKADAIVGLDLDYMVTSNNMFVVIANGTAVQLSDSTV